ncbi:hypothetical protein [Streptomyces sp. NPDC093707]|uniref:hypothetical protein n=1 Tax=Streptomyces sp. NPDC093707 TaxID=3154984 RepID=UPI00344BDC52
MRTAPATHAEVHAWITVLRDHGHLHSVEPGPEGAWTVQRTPTSQPRTLHHPVLALDFFAEVLRDIRRETPWTSR